MVALTDIVPDQHAALLFEWRQRPDIVRFMYSQGAITWAGHQGWLASLPDDESRRHWMIEYQGRPVGSAYLTEIDRAHGRAMLGMYVADEGARMMGVGAATEFLALEQAFGSLGLQKVSCEVFAVNLAPRRMHARMGFKPEGIFRRHAHCDGAWTDVHRSSLLVEEWHEVRPVLHQALRKLLGEYVAVSPS
jgi:UDP-4-amino-4,6-dideoxy-N-acetyl-beta-L-altrosamine N-acetyltransferase